MRLPPNTAMKACELRRTYNRWSFSYTRLNLHLAAAAAASGGCIVVDSTRTGKRFPDSFTATVGLTKYLVHIYTTVVGGNEARPQYLQ